MGYFPWTLLLFVATVALAMDLVDRRQSVETQIVEKLNSLTLNMYQVSARSNVGKNIVITPVGAPLSFCFGLYLLQNQYYNSSTLNDSSIRIAFKILADQWEDTLGYSMRMKGKVEFFSNSNIYQGQDNVWLQYFSYEILEGISNTVVNKTMSYDAFGEKKFMWVNCSVHFYVKWPRSYDIESNEKGFFISSNNKSVTADVMHILGSMSTGDMPSDFGSKYIKLRTLEIPADSTKPLLKNAINIFIILPNKDNNKLEKIEEKIGLIDFGTLKADPTFVNVSLPKFKIKTQLHTENAIKRLNIERAFESLFSEDRLSKQNEVITNTVLQNQVYIEVDESQAIQVGGKNIKEHHKYLPFNINKPFVYAIVHEITNAILFCGRVVDLNETNTSVYIDVPPIIDPKSTKIIHSEKGEGNVASYIRGFVPIIFLTVSMCRILQ